MTKRVARTGKDDVLILGYVENLGTDEKRHVVDTDTDEDFIAGAIEGLVIIAIDLVNATGQFLNCEEFRLTTVLGKERGEEDEQKND